MTFLHKTVGLLRCGIVNGSPNREFLPRPVIQANVRSSSAVGLRYIPLRLIRFINSFNFTLHFGTTHAKC